MELRALVIDDDEIFNLLADVMLRDLGITAHPRCFTSGQAALTYIDRHGGADITYLLFLDINMPHMNGWEVLSRLQSMPNRDQIYVVIVTSSIDRADRQKALGFDCVIDYMTKPLKREKLATVRQNPEVAAFFST